jgi:hypothetical protein
MFLVVLPQSWLAAQQKVAEGEYVMRDTGFKDRASKVISRWVVYGTSGRYELNSEIQNLPSGVRVLEKADIDFHLVPTSVSYELYDKSGSKPTAVLTCSIRSGLLKCSGQSDKGQAPDSGPFNAGAPFWTVVQNLSAFDMVWNLSGALNMARARGNKDLIKVVSISGGAALVLGDKLSIAYLESVKRPGQTVTAIVPEQYTDWEFSINGDLAVRLKGTEQVEIGGVNIATQHYILSADGEPMHLWITDSGLGVKLLFSHENESTELALNNYKQYKQLVPEFSITDQPGAKPKK